MNTREAMIPNESVGPDVISPDRARFRVGPWEVDAPSDLIVHSGMGLTRSLEPRIMSLLCALADKPGEVLTRDELMRRLWPQVIVNENSLTRAVSDLRKALKCEDCEPASAVVTIPKKGYRLDAEVALLDAPIPHKPVPTMRVGYFPRLHRAVLAAAAVLAFTTISLGVQLASVSDSSGISDIADTLEASTPESAMSWLQAQQQSSRIEAFSTANLHSPQIDMASGAGTSLFSRDGELFAYVSYTDAGSSLIIGSQQGFSSPINVYETEELIFNLQWSPVDHVLLFAQKPRFSPATLFGKDDVRLIMFDIRTMAATILTGDGNELQHADPRVFSLT